MVAAFHSTEDSPCVRFSTCPGKVLNQNANKKIKQMKLTRYSLIYAVVFPQGITLTAKLAALI